MVKKPITITLALCAVAIPSLTAITGAASAAKFYIEGKELTSKETVKVTTTAPLVLEGTVTSAGYGKIECEQMNAQPKLPVFHNKEEEIEWNRKYPLPTIESTSKGTWSKGMFLEGCKMVEPASCSIVSNLIANPREQALLLSPTGALSYKFTSESGFFLTYTVRGCAAEGIMSIQGSPECKWAQPETAAVTHKCEFTATSGSTLTAGAHEMIMKASNQYELAGANAGKKWSMR